MKRPKDLLLVLTVLCVALTASTVVGQIETENIITFDALNVGNGNFNTTQADVDAGLVGSVVAFERPNETPGPDPTVSLNRHRVLLPGAGGNRGPFIRGWTNVRRFFQSGNGALGFDGNFGFAAAPFETANGESGQLFTNTGRVEAVSDIYDFNFASGTTVEFEYLIGSDTIRSDNGQPVVALATPSLVFDSGLPTEFREDFAQESGTGIVDPNDDTNLDFNRRTGSYTTTADYSTVQIRFELVNELQLGDLPAPSGVVRSLLDQVALTATGQRTGGGGVMLGDASLDGTVDFADIASFIDLLLNGQFLAEADINGDLLVDFADIPLFIDILINA